MGKNDSISYTELTQEPKPFRDSGEEPKMLVDLAQQEDLGGGFVLRSGLQIDGKTWWVILRYYQPWDHGIATSPRNARRLARKLVRKPK